MPLVIAAVALLGLAIGSFLNVVIYRVPARRSLSTPASHCPTCGHPIRARHNIPVLGWLILRGKCADCSSRISVRYPLVELLTAVLFVAVALQLQHLHLLAALPAFLTFAAASVALTMIDFDVHRLPDSIVLPCYPVLALMLTIAAVVEDHPWALARMALGGLAMWLMYLIMRLAYPKGMGFGDVKLAGVIGGMLGFISWPALLIGAFAGFVLAGVTASIIIGTGLASRKAHIPFGPFMIAGALISVFTSPQISQFYTDLVFRT